MLAPAVPVIEPRKKLIKRASPDRSQRVRRSIQLAFLFLNFWIGAQFYLFVGYYESGGSAMRVKRPAGVEGWLPIASLMNLKVLVETGALPRVHPAGTFLLIAFLAASLIFRKSFCGWLCPVGTISEYLGRLGRKIFGRTFHLPRALDLALRSLKYILMALFLYAVGSMSAAIHDFLDSPYGIVDDVKMLNFFRDLGLFGGSVLAAIAIGSILIQNFWCRYLCPYGALMGLVSLVSPSRIRREATLCIDCAKCAKACPSALPVDRLITIRSTECITCLQCVAACPAEGALFLSALRKKRVPAWAVAAAIATMFLCSYGAARATGHWDTNLPDSVYFRLVPHANEFEHP